MEIDIAIKRRVTDHEAIVFVNGTPVLRVVGFPDRQSAERTAQSLLKSLSMPS